MNQNTLLLSFSRRSHIYQITMMPLEVLVFTITDNQMINSEMARFNSLFHIYTDVACNMSCYKCITTYKLSGPESNTEYI